MTKRNKILQTVGAGALIALFAGNASANLLTNPGFDVDDVSGGDQFGATGWNTFGNGFTASSLFDSGNTPLADSPDNVFKAFGAGSGATQSFAAQAGDVFAGSAVGQNFVGDPFNEPGKLLLQIVFRDAAGGFAGTEAGGNAAPGFNIFDGNAVDWTNPTDNVWTTLGVGTAPAPDNTASVDFNVLVLAPSGGSGFFDSASFEQISEIPVPAAVWLFGSGLLGLLGVARRRKS
jgi:hypothetical protein